MESRMDRSQIFGGSFEAADQQDRLDSAEMEPGEKFRLITYLRECFFGDEATTGRLPRIYRLTQLK